MILRGHFAVFNRWTEINSWIEGRFLERIAPGAFRKTIRENRDRIRVLLNHGGDPQLGDKPLGPIETLREDATGAFYEVALLQGIPELVVEGMREGLYGASFRFEVMREEFVERPEPSEHNPAGIPERTLKELRLFEFGPVTFPAYADATASARSAGDAIELRGLAGREEVVPVRLAPGSSPVTLRRLHADGSPRARQLLRDLGAGAKVEIVWGGQGHSLGRVLEHRRRAGSRPRPHHLPTRESWRL